MNPNMMGMQMQQMPNVPNIQELWKNEKSKYRQWMIMFVIGISLVFALVLSSAIFNTIGRESIEKAMKDAIMSNSHISASDKPDRIDLVPRNVTLYHIILPFVVSTLIGIGLMLFIISLFEAYKKKNFGKLSGFAPFIIGFGAFMAFFSVIRLMWSHNGGTFDNPGGIFQFINNFLLIGVYFGGSMQVSRIRRTFIVSERVEKLKNSPEFKQAQQQMNSAMNGQAPNSTGNPYGPMGMGTPTGAASVNAKTSTKPGEKDKAVQVEKISKERKELESMTVADLKKVAKKLSISGYTTMKKPELIKDILRVTASN